MAESLVPEPSRIEVEIVVGKLKRYKSPGTDQMPAELIEAGCETFRYKIHELILSTWNMDELSQQWKEYVTVPIQTKGDKTYCYNYLGIFLLSVAYNMLCNFLVVRLIPYVSEIIGHYQCWFHYKRSTTDQIFYIHQIVDKNESIMGQYITYLQTSRKPTTELREKFFTKLVKLIKMCLNETYSKARVGKICLINFLFRMG
jgi:hypothetical protein